MIDLDVMGMALLDKTALPFMDRGSYAVLVGSVSSFVPVAGQAVYSAAKAYVRFHGQALRTELKKRGINVLVLSPGNMGTEMNTRGGEGEKAGSLPISMSARLPEIRWIVHREAAASIRQVGSSKGIVSSARSSPIPSWSGRLKDSSDDAGMKQDLGQRRTKFAERALGDFSQALIDALQEQRIESIRVSDLCEMAGYPRSTFYNYFEDLYNLLAYCWDRIANEISLDDYPNTPTCERTRVLFERCYDYLDGHRGTIAKIMRHNPMDGHFVASLRHCIWERIYAIIVTSPCSEKYQIPYKLVAEHYANTIQMLLEWCFIRKKQLSKAEALEALRYLLKGMAD